MFSFLKKKAEVTTSPVTGHLIDLSKVPDPVFADGMMGAGFAVQPSADEIYAPIAGKVTSVFPTKHAIGLKTKDGRDVLIHIGINTVDLQGTGFEIFVDIGDTVTNETKLAKVDRGYIQSQGKNDTIIVVFPEQQEQPITVTEQEVTAKEPIQLG